MLPLSRSSLFLVFIFWLALGNSQAQDIIVPLEGETIQGEVTRLGRWVLRYESAAGEKGRIPLQDLELVIFESGMKQYFQVQPNSQPYDPDQVNRTKGIVATADVPQDSVGYWTQLGRNDAKQYFDAMGAFWGTAALSGLIPIFSLYTGLPSALIIAAVPPKVHLEDLPSPELFYQNQYYAEGFRKQAHRIKVKRTLQGFGTGLLSQGVVLLIIVIALW